MNPSNKSPKNQKHRKISNKEIPTVKIMKDNCSFFHLIFKINKLVKTTN